MRRIGQTTDQLGESCVWSDQEQALFWIDIRGETLRRYDSGADTTASFPLPEIVGSIALHRRGQVVLAMRSRIVLFNWQSGSVEEIAEPHEIYENQRFNDGKCDRQGRFWAGTMNDVDRGLQGTLYRLDRNRRLAPMLGPLTIPNSLAWSPEGRTMYFSDTTSRVITAYDFDPETGTPANPREFARVEAPGTPDGSTVDAEGFLWNAEYDGWKVTRYAPNGQVDRTIPLPVQRPTCCAFGGPDLSTLFVTTAAQRLTDEELTAQPFAGGLLALDAGVKGVAEPCYIC